MPRQTPVGYYLRFLRTLDPSDTTIQATEALDDLNKRGVTDRDLLLASTLINGHLIQLLASLQGHTVDQLTETLIREWTDQTS